MAADSPRILIVDDAPVNLRLRQAIFENEGFDIILADSGEAALSRVSSSPPAIVLLDVSMPGMSGIETLIKLKEIAPDVQVIMITAYADVTSAVDAMKRGAEDFLIRPVQSDRLVLTVRRALERRELKTQLEKIQRRKDREQELIRARDAAFEMARNKSEFLANVSHEIRTPLHTIVGFTEMLLVSDLGVCAREQVETIRSSSQLLVAIVNEILDFSKLEAGKGVLEKVGFGLDELLTQTVGAFAPIAASKRISLNSRIDPKIPRRLRGDPQRLRQVLNNLISNAIKFTSEGHVSITVTQLDEAKLEQAKLGKAKLEEAKSDALILFEVQDTGIGVPEQLHQSLFQPFVQAGGADRPKDGTGLGLAIAARIVDQMGGLITLSSAPGCGSTFRFTARFERDSSAQERPAASRTPSSNKEDPDSPQAPSAEERKFRRNIRVLVVEDNKTNRALCAWLLEFLGYTVDVVEDGLKALEALSSRDYQIVLMDCQMPRMDGYKATAEIRRRERDPKHTVIIALTAHAFAAIHERCLAAGMDDFLTKPVTLKSLCAILDHWTRKIISGEVNGAAAGHTNGALPPAQNELSQSYFSEMRALSAAAGTDVLQDLVETFLSELPELLAAVISAMRARSLEDLREAGHAVKGAANSVGATGFAMKCKRLEDSAEASELDAALRDARDLLAAAEALPELLRTAVKMQPDDGLRA